MKLPLIRRLEEDKRPVEEKLPSGISYQEYELEVGKGTHKILIPLRECESFEQRLSELSEIDTVTIKMLLREFRGIRG